MEATSTLADALLDDLDDLNDSGDDQIETQSEKVDEVIVSNTYHVNDLNKLSHLLNNPSLQHHLKIVQKIIRENLKNNSKEGSTTTHFQSERSKKTEEEDHKLVIKSNKYLASLAEELGRAHEELAKIYSKKFPELEELLPNYQQYKNAVKVIKNEMDLTRVNDELNEILTSNQIITISVAASTTSGRLLTGLELEAIDFSVTYIEKLLEIQQQLIIFVEYSMESLCPSICALIGSSLAARLLGLTGGLQELTKIPSCNLQVLGQIKVNSESRAGFSSTNAKQHAGVLVDCELVQSISNAHRQKALKAVAGKLALAARYDFSNVDSGRPRNASVGVSYKDQLRVKFEKWQEPDRAPVLKALPKPNLDAKKRRGGRRMRRMKERFEETAMMKQANTRAFRTQQGEYGDDSMGITMGLLDTADNGGAIRRVTEKRKMRQADTKASRKRAMQMAQKAKNKDGLASSVVFTQTSGMELINPEANKQRIKAANEKWFKSNAGFQSALSKKKA